MLQPESYIMMISSVSVTHKKKEETSPRQHFTSIRKRKQLLKGCRDFAGENINGRAVVENSMVVP